MHAFVGDADDAIEWIQEKEIWVTSQDYGKDLEEVRALIAKHEGFEQDLAAISEQGRGHMKVGWLIIRNQSDRMDTRKGDLGDVAGL